jgi:hypothetical protein
MNSIRGLKKNTNINVTSKLFEFETIENRKDNLDNKNLNSKKWVNYHGPNIKLKKNIGITPKVTPINSSNIKNQRF